MFKKAKGLAPDDAVVDAKKKIKEEKKRKEQAAKEDERFKKFPKIANEEAEGDNSDDESEDDSDGSEDDSQVEENGEAPSAVSTDSRAGEI